MNRSFALVAVGMAGLVSGPPMWPQAAAPGLTFEVVSVKPGKPAAQSAIGYYPGGRFTARTATLKALIMYAYGMSDGRVIGGPQWVDVDRYDIDAVPPSGIEPAAAESQIKPMLRKLLAERFQLSVRQETRTLPTFALELGDKGNKMRETTGDPYRVARGSVAEYRKSGLREFTFVNVPMEAFAARLSGDIASADLGRPVHDATGLKLHYDFVLRWRPTNMSAKTAMDSDSGPSIFQRRSGTTWTQTDAGKRSDQNPRRRPRRRRPDRKLNLTSQTDGLSNSLSKVSSPAKPADQRRVGLANIRTLRVIVA